MEDSPVLLTWIITVSGLVSLLLIGGVAAVLWYHQRRLAAQARAWGVHLLEAQEAERQRIAKDLHDDVVQRIWTAQMQLDVATAPVAVGILNEVSRDLRCMARDLYPPSLQLLTLARALHDLVGLQPEGVEPAVTACADESLTLPVPSMVALYRVAQEGLQNVRKHGAARHAEFRLTKVGPWVELTLTDDGRGFDVAAAAKNSFGLRSMRERLALAGGTIDIQSALGSGTTLIARVPCAQHQPVNGESAC